MSWYKFLVELRFDRTECNTSHCKTFVGKSEQFPSRFLTGFVFSGILRFNVLKGNCCVWFLMFVPSVNKESDWCPRSAETVLSVGTRGRQAVGS